MAANDALRQLFDDHWNYQLERWPTSATYNGDHRFDDKLQDVSIEAFQRDEATVRSFLDRLKLISSDATLSPEDQLNAELFERDLNLDLEGLTLRRYLMPVSQQSGPQMILPELLNVQPFDTEKGCEDFIARLKAFPRLINQTISNMQVGVTEKLVPARVNVEAALPQFRSQIVDTVENHLLASAADKFGDTIPSARRAELRAGLLAAIRDQVIPAYKRIAAYMEQDYLPACRTEVGVRALPNGKERYRIEARRYTTTSLTPEEISQIGRRELARVHEQMRSVMRQVGFEGTIAEFADSLRHDSRFYYSDPDSLVNGFKAILAKMDTKLPELFGRLPDAQYGFRVMEPYRAVSAPDAYYYPAPEDRSRPGYFYINTYNLNMRPKYTMEALAYHEAVPGHHLQLALQQELENLPMFRQHGGYTAFVEGWALYSEALPKEVGFYSDPYSEFGRLTFDAWRCTRLIVDPGIHYFGWTRKQAIDFFRENTALSDLNIQSEVDRYIAWPGQALAYKIGQLQISELRHSAETALGDRFDLRAFHDALLEDGALPLDILETKMTRWIETQRAMQ